MNAATLARLFVLSDVNERRNDPKHFYDILREHFTNTCSGTSELFRACSGSSLTTRSFEAFVASCISAFFIFAVYCVTSASDCCVKPTVHECGRGEAVAGAETRSWTHRVVLPMAQAVSRLGVRTKVSP